MSQVSDKSFIQWRSKACRHVDEPELDTKQVISNLRLLQLRLPVKSLVLLVGDNQRRWSRLGAELVLDRYRVRSGVVLLDRIHFQHVFRRRLVVEHARLGVVGHLAPFALRPFDGRHRKAVDATTELRRLTCEHDSTTRNGVRVEKFALESSLYD
jgi:hypothetical protein